MRFLLVALVMLLSNVTSFAVEEFASDEVNVENVTEMVSSDTQIDGADSDDGFDFGLIIVCALFVAFFVRFAFFDGMLTDRKRVLVPRCKLTKQEKVRKALLSLPFFCIAISLAVISKLELDFMEYDGIYFLFLSVAFLSVAIYVMRYRESYYDKKGEMIRKIRDVVVMLFIMIIPLIGIHSFVLQFLEIVLLCLKNILDAKLKKCEVIKPEVGDEE